MDYSYAKKFTTEVLEYASDCYRKPASPLLADAYYNMTKEHLRGDYGKSLQCKDIVFSNLARQMNFIRTLYSIYKLDGDESFFSILKNNLEFYFTKCQYPAGLIEWGGHRLIDLQTLTSVGEPVHELKNDYPAYAIMYQIDGERTLRYIEALWNAHVYNWETLEISRHGDYLEKRADNVWDHEFCDPQPFKDVIGLSFINAGNDLIYSAIEYYKLTGNRQALVWAKRLQYMYVKARHSKTGLGVYQYNQPKRRDETDDFSITTSNYGDRAKRQLGPELGEYALEGNVLIKRKTDMIYGYNILMTLYEYQTTGDALPEFLTYAKDALEAYAKYAYIPEKNSFKPLLADGQNLAGFIMQRDGYYGKKGSVFSEFAADGLYFLSFSKTAVLSASKALWNTASDIAQGLGFGYMGDRPGQGSKLNLNTNSVCPLCLFAFLNLFKLTGDKPYFEIACVIADNITKAKDGDIIYINKLEPLAVTCRDAVLTGKQTLLDTSIYL